MTNYEKLKSLVKDAKILRDAQKEFNKNGGGDDSYLNRKESEFDEKLQVLYNEINWIGKK